MKTRQQIKEEYRIKQLELIEERDAEIRKNEEEQEAIKNPIDEEYWAKRKPLDAEWKRKLKEAGVYYT